MAKNNSEDNIKARGSFYSVSEASPAPNVTLTVVSLPHFALNFLEAYDYLVEPILKVLVQ